MIDQGKILRLMKWEMVELTRTYIAGNLNPYLKSQTDKYAVALRDTIDWEHLTKDDALALGFMEWTYLAGKELWLIPFWLYLSIPQNLPLIDAETHKEFFFSRGYIAEPKFGMLPYGLLFDTDTEEENTNQVD